MMVLTLRTLLRQPRPQFPWSQPERAGESFHQALVGAWLHAAVGEDLANFGVCLFLDRFARGF